MAFRRHPLGDYDLLRWLEMAVHTPGARHPALDGRSHDAVFSLPATQEQGRLGSQPLGFWRSRSCILRRQAAQPRTFPDPSGQNNHLFSSLPCEPQLYLSM